MRLRSSTFPLLVLFILVASQGLASAQSAVPAQHHAWGRFRLGSRKSVRVRTENLSPTGEVTNSSVTETTTTLTGIDDTGYTLRIDVVVEVAGRRYASEPKTTRIGFSGEQAGQRAVFTTLGSRKFEVGDQTVPCEIREVVINGTDARRVTQLYYSSRQAPHVLKRSTVATKADDGSPKYSSSVETLAVNMPYPVLNETMMAAFTKTVVEHDRGQVITMEVHCMDVPGGVVFHTSKELDNEGQVVRRSTLELFDYYVETGESQTVRQHWMRRRWRLRSR